MHLEKTHLPAFASTTLTTLNRQEETIGKKSSHSQKLSYHVCFIFLIVVCPHISLSFSVRLIFIKRKNKVKKQYVGCIQSTKSIKKPSHNLKIKK